MNGLSSVKRRVRAGVGFTMMAALLCAASIIHLAAEGTNAPAVNTVSPKSTDSKPAEKTARKTLSGAELYSMHCNRCHPERYPTERTSAQWKTIVLHMRVRANIPAEQARTILKYLQDNSGR
jgi:hypothetical protein